MGYQVFSMSEPGQIATDASTKSSFFEQLVEHYFISEILQEVYYGHGRIVEVLRAEVDASGYDLVMECNGFLRHIQLKTSRQSAKTASQKVHVKLGEKYGGCVVWIFREESSKRRRADLSYRYFGGKAGESLPSLDAFKVATHTKGNSLGRKTERPMIRVIPKSKFAPLPDLAALVELLFALPRGAF